MDQAGNLGGGADRAPFAAGSRAGGRTFELSNKDRAPDEGVPQEVYTDGMPKDQSIH